VKRAAFLALACLSACGAPPPSVDDAGGSDAGAPPFDAGAPDAGASDAGTTDAGVDAGTIAPRCTVTSDAVHCPSSSLAVPIGAGFTRNVNFSLPGGIAPDGGWPVALLFQGSFSPSAQFFDAARDASFGLYDEALTTSLLLDDGFAVLAPEAHAAGNGYWDTNVLPWAISWTGAPDDVFVTAIFDAIDAGQFGPLSTTRWYAGGISSGGFMSSRMAVSYPGRFRALAIASGGYASCGPTCLLPATMPAQHPPTLFLHGANDVLAPVANMLAYRDALADAGVPVQTIIDPSLGHQWIPAAPQAIRAWFSTH